MVEHRRPAPSPLGQVPAARVARTAKDSEGPAWGSVRISFITDPAKGREPFELPGDDHAIADETKAGRIPGGGTWQRMQR
jgi:hypothetical protein